MQYGGIWLRQVLLRGQRTHAEFFHKSALVLLHYSSDTLSTCEILTRRNGYRNIRRLELYLVSCKKVEGSALGFLDLPHLGSFTRYLEGLFLSLVQSAITQMYNTHS